MEWTLGSVRTSPARPARYVVLKHSQQGTKYVASGPQLVPLGPYDEILGEIENKYVLKQTEYVRWRPLRHEHAQQLI